MKNFQKLLTFFFILAFISHFSSDNTLYDSSEKIDKVLLHTNGNSILLVTSSPISIQNSKDLDIFADEINNGNSSQYPIIIENQKIDLQNHTIGILIKNTTKHVLIRNCEVTNANNNGGTGIYLHNSSNLRIENNKVSNLDIAIDYSQITNTSISKNILNSSYYTINGRWDFTSDNINITNNEISGTSYAKTLFSRVNNFVFENNIVLTKGWIDFSNCANLSIQNNQFGSIKECVNSIDLFNGKNFIIQENNIYSNEEPISIFNSAMGNISNNTCFSTSFDPLYISSSNFIFIRNNFISSLNYQDRKMKNIWPTPFNGVNKRNFEQILTKRLRSNIGILFLDTNNSEICNNSINFNINGIILFNSANNSLSQNILNIITITSIYSDEPDLNIIQENEVINIKIWKEYPIFIFYFIGYSVISIGYLGFLKISKKKSEFWDLNPNEKFQRENIVEKTNKSKETSTFSDCLKIFYGFFVLISLTLGTYGYLISTIYLYSIGYLIMIGIIYALKKKTFNILSLDNRKGKKNRITIFHIINMIGILLGVLIIMGKSIEMLKMIIKTPIFIQIDYGYYFQTIWFTLPLIFLSNPIEIKVLLKREIPSLEVH